MVKFRLMTLYSQLAAFFVVVLPVIQLFTESARIRLTNDKMMALIGFPRRLPPGDFDTVSPTGELQKED